MKQLKSPQNKTQRQSVRQELNKKARSLGLSPGKTLFPEQPLSPHYGDPTLVDDRPFARQSVSF
ncbi:hypothetical protein IQ249_08595 [Lusitaniella coriacea LEGE 07157]|uniref:Uncharacterized protein n=1 Tax=Lusitaniella coriacea LEGE 07157 TaxID=945747 RepID=A0A8J7DVS2_9CYAN|nr:hypothetical protein [Lusitaniella coriacea]MBE9115949.1 hypothetical protein [Lusitaniella coriacea LEGE 07157]